MNHHKFHRICVLKYHQKIWCLVIYKSVYQVSVYCNTRYYFSKHFFVTNSDQLTFFCREFMNHYKVPNHKFGTIFFSASR